MEQQRTPILTMRGISKAFPGVQALQDVDLALYPGSVLALVGENGAGKSTLVKILSGVHKMDAGEIALDGQPIHITDPLSSLNMGISIIYQELNLLSNMNIAENIFIGREQKTKMHLLDKKRQHREARVLLDEVGLAVPTSTRVRALSTAQKQMVEVAKALSFNARIIIMDEPTSSLTDTETDTLFQIIGKLRDKGVAIVFISHRMNEIFEISDEVAVMRDGEMVERFTTREVTENDIINAMVGREVKNIYAKEPAAIGEVVLEVKGLNAGGFLKDISFSVRAGEILGFAGLVGAGRSEVMRAAFGIDKRESGQVFLSGQETGIRNTVDMMRCHIGFVPEDRKEQGLILKSTVGKNITLAALQKVANGWFIDARKEEGMAEGYVDALRIKTPSLRQRVNNLSGGNQQKVVISKWMAVNPKVLVLDEPTRGIDVGAKKEIHQLMSKLAGEGVAIIMISSELPEILGMSDRIIVMHEGRIKGELAREEANQAAIMQMAVS